MHLFGCRFYDIGEDGEKVFDRKNFDSLFWATITVFQILTQSDWPEVMYRGMEKNGPWASLYFIILSNCPYYVHITIATEIILLFSRFFSGLWKLCPIQSAGCHPG